MNREWRVQGHIVTARIEERSYHGREPQPVWIFRVDGKLKGELRPCGYNVFPCVSPPELEIWGGRWVLAYKVDNGRYSEDRGVDTGIKFVPCK